MTWTPRLAPLWLLGTLTLPAACDATPSEATPPTPAASPSDPPPPTAREPAPAPLPPPLARTPDPSQLRAAALATALSCRDWSESLARGDRALQPQLGSAAPDPATVRGTFPSWMSKPCDDRLDHPPLESPRAALALALESFAPAFTELAEYLADDDHLDDPGHAKFGTLLASYRSAAPKFRLAHAAFLAAVDAEIRAELRAMTLADDDAERAMGELLGTMMDLSDELAADPGDLERYEAVARRYEAAAEAARPRVSSADRDRYVEVRRRFVKGLRRDAAARRRWEAERAAAPEPEPEPAPSSKGRRRHAVVSVRPHAPQPADPRRFDLAADLRKAVHEYIQYQRRG